MYEFVQVTARKGESFALCSNLSMMDYRRATPEEAEVLLQEMAAEYARDGYDIEWTREKMCEKEIAIWGGLFKRVAA